MAQLDSLVVIRFQVCIFDILNTANLAKKVYTMLL